MQTLVRSIKIALLCSFPFNPMVTRIFGYIHTASGGSIQTVGWCFSGVPGTDYVLPQREFTKPNC